MYRSDNSEIAPRRTRSARQRGPGLRRTQILTKSGNRTQNSRVAGARANHQLIGDLETPQGGVGTREEPALLVEINVGVHFTPLKI